MKIVIDARNIYTSTGRYAEKLLEYLQQIDHSNKYIVLLLKKDFDRWQPTALNFTKMIADYPIYSLREQLQFTILLYRLRADLVHFTMPQQPVLYFGRHITTIHDLTLIDVINKRKFNALKSFYKNTLKPLVFKIALRWFILTSAKIITPTNFVRKQLINRFGINKNKIIVTYEAADDLAVVASKPGFMKPEDKFIMYLGNAYPYKNVRRLIEAFGQLKSDGRYRKLKLVLVGKREFFYEELASQTADAGIEDVVFTDFVPDDEAAWLYRHTQAFITASLSEGFGLPGLEAMVYGAPVLSSNASCLPEVYGEAADYFNPYDAGDIAEAINKLLQDPQRLVELRAAGPHRLSQFSWRKLAEETLAVYKSAI